MTEPTQGEWSVACDSYGKVRHSKKACVYTNVRQPGGDLLVTVAARIPNWADAKLMAAAKEMLAALEGVARSPDCARAVTEYNAVLAAIEKAKGEMRSPACD